MTVETLKFSTQKKKRAAQPVEVILCGEPMTLQRPKDAVLYFAQTVVGDAVSDADRAAAILQFINSTLDPGELKHYFDRVLDRDDPVDLRATLELVGGVIERWNNYPSRGKPDPVIVESSDDDTRTETAPITVQNRDLDLEFEAHRPKDIVLLFVAGSLSTSANLGQQAWAVGLFLDAALTRQDALVVAHRMRSQHDDLDLEHIAEIVTSLAQRWAPGPTNRAMRRATARTSRA